MTMKIFDAEKGEEFKLIDQESKNEFSNLKQNLFVIDDPEKILWEENIDFILKCISATSVKGYFIVTPWVPGRDALMQSIYDLNEKLWNKEKDYDLFYFDVKDEPIKELFKIREKFGGYNSGEWVIGGCNSYFNVEGFKKNELTTSDILLQDEKIGCLLELYEMHQSLFITIKYAGFEGDLKRIMKS